MFQDIVEMLKSGVDAPWAAFLLRWTRWGRAGSGDFRLGQSALEQGREMQRHDENNAKCGGADGVLDQGGLRARCDCFDLNQTGHGVLPLFVSYLFSFYGASVKNFVRTKWNKTGDCDLTD
jgi:hypothetical protein